MNQSESPVSFPVNVARMPQRGMPVDINATEEQRAALAREHELDSVKFFKVKLMVTPWKRHGVRVNGKVDALIGQTCVVTLEPLENRISEEFEAVFLPENSKLAREGFGLGGEIILDVEGDDSPETFSGDWIDVGALAEEYFGLAIDPYPRKGDVHVDAAPDDEEAQPDADSFAGKLKAALNRSKNEK